VSSRFERDRKAHEERMGFLYMKLKEVQGTNQSY
jgi:hypothetical protein